MNQDLLQLTDNKLAISLKSIDDKICSEIRAEWNVFSPDPNGPTGGSVQEKIKDICHRGFLERERVAEEQLENILNQHSSLMNDKLAKEIIKVLGKHFPDDKYVTLSSKTEEVYLRKCAPRSRLADRQIELNQSLIVVGAKNMSRKSVHALTQTVNDYNLRAKQGKQSITKKAMHGLANFILIPSIKWVFGIISAVITGVLIYHLTGNG